MGKTARSRRSPAASLPKRHPKKTGKAGIGPAPEQPESEDPKKPKQARLPQMEDPAIEELENKAEEYADIRDQRMELTPVESKLNTELLGLMKKHGKTTYKHAGIEVKIVVESEKVKVKIKKED